MRPSGRNGGDVMPPRILLSGNNPGLATFFDHDAELRIALKETTQTGQVARQGERTKHHATHEHGLNGWR